MKNSTQMKTASNKIMNSMVNFNKLCIDNAAIIHEKNGHKVMIKQYSVSLKEELPIYRYVRLSYLIDAINNRRLFVPSIKQFSDLIEKNGCRKYDDLQLIRPVPAYKDKLRNKKIDKEMDGVLSMCAKCWTLDKRSDGTIGESMLMWRTYASNEIVCRIGTTIKDVVDSIINIESDIIFADVNYGRSNNLNIFESVLFNKSIYYDHEQEIRMLYLTENKNGTYININPLTMLKEITLSPFIPPQTASFVISQLRNICLENPQIDMHISPINEYSGDLPEYMNNNKVWR